MSTISKAPFKERCLLFGGSGLLGSELKPFLETQGWEVFAPDHAEADCRSEAAVREAVHGFRPQAVVMAAARVGGILANMRGGSDFLYDNALMNLVTLRVCAEEGIGKILVFGSSCMYPNHLSRPMTPEDLLTGPLEPTSIGYAVAKLAAAEYARALRREGKIRATVCVLTSLYGDRDHFSAEEGHLISSLMVKFHDAKETGKDQVELWGDGTPRRDFLHAADAASACLALLRSQPAHPYVNLGSGFDLTVREIAEKAAEAVGFRGRLVFGGGVGNGTPRRLLDTARIRALGWRPEIPLEEGLRSAYRSYLVRPERRPAVKPMEVQ